VEEEKKPELIRIFMNDRPFELRKEHYTGSELKARTDVPAGDLLYRIKGHNREEIADHQSIEIHQDEHFVAVPGHGGAGWWARRRAGSWPSPLAKAGRYSEKPPHRESL
jgi:hypothetical protein